MKTSLLLDDDIETPTVSAYLVDCEKWLQEHPIPTIPPNPLVFAQDALAQRPGMEWLASVSCTLFSPENEDIDTQKKQLSDFLATLKKDASFLPKDFSSALSDCGFEGAPFISLDLETTGLDTRVLYDYDGNLCPKTKIVGVCIATSDTVGYYLPLRHTGEDGVLNWNEEALLDFLQKIVDSFLLIFHNAQYDKEVLSLSGVKTRKFPYFLDTMILHFMSDVGQKRHGLKFVSEQLLGRKMIEISQLFSEMGVKTKAHINFDKLCASGALVYAVSDALNTFGLFLVMAQVTNDRNVFLQQPIPLTIDHKLVDVLRNLYRSGFPVNIDFAIASSKDILIRRQTLRRKMFEFVGREFDIQSPSQISKLLFEEYKIPPLEGMERGKPTKKNPQGLYSTEAEILEELYEKHPDIPILGFIVQYRQLSLAINNVFSKIINNSYVDALIPYTRSQAQYSMTVIPTGRLSSSSGSGREGVLANETKKGNVTYSYEKGGWGCGFNTQGIPKPDKKQAVAKKILSIPSEAEIPLEIPYPPEIEEELIKLVSQV